MDSDAAHINSAAEVVSVLAGFVRLDQKPDGPDIIIALVPVVGMDLTGFRITGDVGLDLVDDEAGIGEYLDDLTRGQPVYVPSPYCRTATPRCGCIVQRGPRLEAESSSVSLPLSAAWPSGSPQHKADRIMAFSWLGREDSNLRWRNQNPLPYPLATPHPAPACIGRVPGKVKPFILCRSEPHQHHQPGLVASR